MAPNFLDNDLVIATKLSFFNVNDVVIIKTNLYGNVLKRIRSIKNNAYEAVSDNQSYDSKINNEFFEKNQILGKVILKI